MTLTCAYDHRIIQGAESGAFLGSVILLMGTRLYEEVFNHLRAAHAGALGDRPQADAARRGARYAEIAKGRHHPDDNAYVRGLIADLDARQRAEPARRTGSGDLRADHLGSGSRVLTGSLGEAIGGRAEIGGDAA